MPCLSAGPGWDWTTLTSFYPDVNIYTKQLRALEESTSAHPDSPALRFLLAYHYMICGHDDAAANQLKVAVQLDPKDRLSAQLLEMLTPTKAEATATPAAPAAPAKPIDAAALVGNWKATRVDGVTIALSLSKEGTYTWKFDQNGKPQEFAGPYAVADNLLILKKGDTPVMVGQVSDAAGRRVQLQAPRRQPERSGPGVHQVTRLETSELGWQSCCHPNQVRRSPSTSPSNPHKLWRSDR